MVPVCGKDVPEVREALSLYFVAAALFPKALRIARFWIDTSTDFESDSIHSIRELLASDRERRLTICAQVHLSTCTDPVSLER